MSAKEVLDHIPKVSKKLIDYVDNVALLRSRYLFITKAAGVQFAYCTHCRKQYTPNYLLGPFKHNEIRNCEKCGSVCKVKDSWRGRSKLIDEAYIVWYEKSVLNPKAVVAQGIHVQRDYTGDYKDVQTKFYIPVIYLFEPGDPRAAGKDRFGRSLMFRKNWTGKFVETSSVYSERDQYARRLPLFVSDKNIETAVEGTQLQYSQWRKFLEYRTGDEEVWHGFNIFTRYAGEALTDMVAFFDLATRYPCVEYLAKMGLDQIVSAKLDGRKMYGAINWRGFTMEKVLRMTKAEAKDLISAAKAGIEITPLTLYSYKFHKHHKDGGIQLTFEQAHALRDLTFDTYDNAIQELGLPYSMIVKYVLKQMARRKYANAYDVVRTWRDYLADCRKLEMDTSSDAVRYPNDLHKAHQKTIEKVKYKEDKALNAKIGKRLNSLIEKYAFEHDGLMIRPAVDSIELFREGKALNHCVGSYAKRYADGTCDLLVIRRIEEPDKPFYTMEVANGKVQQCRGLNNCDMTPEVKAFVELFKAEKLEKKKARVKVAVRQEVAV